MPLFVPEPPHQAAESVRLKINAIAAGSRLGTPALRRATGPLQLSDPHQVFTLGLTDLAAGQGLERAKPTGWRYLVQEGDSVIAAAETVRTDAVDDHAFSAFNEGRFVSSTAEAIRTARELPALQEDSFELRLLQVPALHLTAVWLYGGTGAGDLLVPLSPSPVDLPAGVAVPAARLLDELTAKARVLAASANDDRLGS